MAGTTEGGRKAAITNRARYGKRFYQLIGRIGGSATFAECGTIKGFARNPELAKIAGAKGGKVGKRGKAIGEKKK
jgi:general stress protein YciG